MVIFHLAALSEKKIWRNISEKANMPTTTKKDNWRIVRSGMCWFWQVNEHLNRTAHCCIKFSFDIWVVKWSTRIPNWAINYVPDLGNIWKWSGQQITLVAYHDIFSWHLWLSLFISFFRCPSVRRFLSKESLYWSYYTVPNYWASSSPTNPGQ